VSSQHEQAVSIAPEHALIRYLSVMRRALTTIAFYTKTRDRVGLQLSGLLANALHNVPPKLLHYDDPFIQGPLPLERWLGHVFPSEIAERGLPEHVLAASASIFSREGELAELGLQPDRKNLRLAPVESMKHHLDLLYDLWLGMRGDLGSRGESGPDNTNYILLDALSLTCQFTRRVPVILVRWSELRESAFWEGAIRKSSTSSDQVKMLWKQYVERAKPPWVKLGPSQEKHRIASPPPSPPLAPKARELPEIAAPRPPTEASALSARPALRFRPYQWVTDHIALGSAISEEDIKTLVRDGITHVLDCRLGPGSKALYERTGIVYRQLGVADDGKPKADEWFWSGIDFVTRARKMPRNRVLVHCKMGMSRSPTMVYAILLAQGMSSEDAQALISKSRIVAKVTYERDASRAARRWTRRSRSP
jgi:dual specificity phosphatase 3